MTSKVICYFQEVEPSASAVSIRAQYFIRSLAGKPNTDFTSIHVLTATKTAEANNRDKVFYISMPIGRSDDVSSAVRRIIAETLFGLGSAAWVFRNRRDAALVISSPNYISALVISMTARLLRMPYLLDVRDTYPEAYAESGLLSDSSLLYKLFMRASIAMYRNAVSITTATAGLERIVSEFNRNTQCIYNGFPESLPSIRTPKHERFTVCFHGVMGYFQDIETLAALIVHPKLASIDFVVIGYGRKSGLIESIKSGNLRYLGRLPHTETIREVSKCHLGLSLRTFSQLSVDSFPVKIWEYMGLAIPSLVSPESEAGQFLVDANCGIQFTSRDVDQIAQMILDVRADKTRYEDMVHSCEKIQSRYSRERLSEVFADNVIASLKSGPE